MFIDRIDFNKGSSIRGPLYCGEPLLPFQDIEVRLSSRSVRCALQTPYGLSDLYHRDFGPKPFEESLRTACRELRNQFEQDLYKTLRRQGHDI